MGLLGVAELPLARQFGPNHVVVHERVVPADLAARITIDRHGWRSTTRETSRIGIPMSPVAALLVSDVTSSASWIQ